MRHLKHFYHLMSAVNEKHDRSLTAFSFICQGTSNVFLHPKGLKTAFFAPERVTKMSARLRIIPLFVFKLILKEDSFT